MKKAAAGRKTNGTKPKEKRETWSWQDIYPELVNKVRWALGTSFKIRGSNYPYGRSQMIATVLSQLIIDLMKVAEDEPGVLDSTSTVRTFFEQQFVGEGLDELT